MTTQLAHNRGLRVSATALLCLLPTAAIAQVGSGAPPQAGAPAATSQPSAQDRDNARTLLFEGRKKMAAGEHQAALKLFQAAHAIVNVPTTGLDLARAQEAVHQLIEARETALAVTRSPVDPGEPKVFAKARSEASELASALNQRIPSLVVTVGGAPAGVQVIVTIDGAVLPPATVGLPRRMNPGKHTLEVKAARFATTTREVELKESETRTEAVKLEPAGAAASGAGLAGAGQTGSGERGNAARTSPATLPRRDGPPGNIDIPVWAWASGGAALAAAGVSIGFLVDYLDARSTLERDCPDNTCDPTRYDLDAMNALRGRWNRSLGISVGMGAVFLAGAGVAITGIVTAPGSMAPKTGFTVVPWTDAEGGGLLFKGAF